MKIQKGIVKNINKKLLTGTLVLTVFTVGLTGCNNIGFSYKENVRNEIIVTGQQDYSIVSKYFIVEMEENQKNNLYLIDIYYDKDNNNILHGIDVFTGEMVVSLNVKEQSVLNDKNIVSIYELEDYLVRTKQVKDYYNIEDLEIVLENFKKDMISDNKVLVKK